MYRLEERSVFMYQRRYIFIQYMNVQVGREECIYVPEEIYIYTRYACTGWKRGVYSCTRGDIYLYNICMYRLEERSVFMYQRRYIFTQDMHIQVGREGCIHVPEEIYIYTIYECTGWKRGVYSCTRGDIFLFNI